MVYSVYSGAGNDFVMINNIEGDTPFAEQKEFTIKLCNGEFKQIDGVIFVEKGNHPAKIRMNYYNRDGSYGAMCGNGARCTVLYASDENIIEDKKYILEAAGKLYEAEIKSDGNIKICFPPPDEYKFNLKLKTSFGIIEANYMNTGSNHLIIFLEDNESILGEMDTLKIKETGRELRYHDEFKPKGANVNFAEILPGNKIRVRTYERGVERETLACGTGLLATALTAFLVKKVKSPVELLTESSEWLTAGFKYIDEKFENVSLEGGAKKIENYSE